MKLSLRTTAVLKAPSSWGGSGRARVSSSREGPWQRIDRSHHRRARQLLIVADADDSYDFSDLTPFLVKLREGNALVQGCRLSEVDGILEKGAMPLVHRHFGNPFFSYLARAWLCTLVNDIYCGAWVYQEPVLPAQSTVYRDGVCHRSCNGQASSPTLRLRRSAPQR